MGAILAANCANEKITLRCVPETWKFVPYRSDIQLTIDNRWTVDVQYLSLFHVRSQNPDSFELIRDIQSVKVETGFVYGPEFWTGDKEIVGSNVLFGNRNIDVSSVQASFVADFLSAPRQMITWPTMDGDASVGPKNPRGSPTDLGTVFNLVFPDHPVAAGDTWVSNQYMGPVGDIKVLFSLESFSTREAIITAQILPNPNIGTTQPYRYLIDRAAGRLTKASGSVWIRYIGEGLTYSFTETLLKPASQVLSANP